MNSKVKEYMMKKELATENGVVPCCGKHRFMCECSYDIKWGDPVHAGHSNGPIKPDMDGHFPWGYRQIA